MYSIRTPISVAAAARSNAVPAVVHLAFVADANAVAAAADAVTVRFPVLVGLACS